MKGITHKIIPCIWFHYIKSKDRRRLTRVVDHDYLREKQESDDCGGEESGYFLGSVWAVNGKGQGRSCQSWHCSSLMVVTQLSISPLSGTLVTCIFLPTCHNHRNKDIKATTAKIPMPGSHPGPRTQNRSGRRGICDSNTPEAEAAICSPRAEKQAWVQQVRPGTPSPVCVPKLKCHLLPALSLGL